MKISNRHLTFLLFFVMIVSQFTGITFANIESTEIIKPSSSISFSEALNIQRSLELAGGAWVEGNVTVYDGTVNMHNNGRVQGDLYRTASVSLINQPQYTSLKTITSKKTYQMPDIVFPDTPISTDTFTRGWGSTTSKDITVGMWNNNILTYRSITLESNATLKIDIGNANRTLIVETLQGAGQIEVLGTGKLTIYAKEIAGSFTGSSSSIKPSTTANASIYLYAFNEGTISFANGFNLQASLYAPKANVSFAGGMILDGSIVAGGNSVYLSNNSKVKGIYAPNADVSIVGGSQVIGGIICKSYKGTNNALVKYQSYSIPVISDQTQNRIIINRATKMGNPEKPVMNEPQRITYTLSEEDIFFSTINPTPKEIALVIDASYSMTYSVDGKTSGVSSTQQRMYLAKHAATNFINRFDKESVKIALITYGTNVSEDSFIDVRDKQQLLTKIDNIKAEPLSTGGTSTGNALRKAYYKLKNTGNSSAKKYIVLLTDGRPNFWISRTSNNTNVLATEKSNFVLTANAPAEYLKGQVSFNNTTINIATEYAKDISKIIAADSSVSSYMVGFATNAEDTDALESIGTSIRAKDNNRLFFKSSSTELNELYQQMAEEIRLEDSYIVPMTYSELLPIGVQPLQEDGVSISSQGTGQNIRYRINKTFNVRLIKQGDFYRLDPQMNSFDIAVQYSKTGRYNFLGSDASINYTGPFGITGSVQNINPLSIVVVDKYPKVKIEVRDDAGKVEPVFEKMDPNMEPARQDVLLNEARVLQRNPFAFFNIRGNNLSKAQYQFVKKDAPLPSNMLIMPTTGWQDLDLTSDVMWNTKGLNARYYNVEHLGYMNATDWEDRNKVFANPKSQIVYKTIWHQAIFGSDGDNLFFPGPTNHWVADGSYSDENSSDRHTEAAKFWGYFIPDVDGTYYFGVYSDDGTNGYLYVDGQQIQFSNDWTFHEPLFSSKEQIKPVQLTKGQPYPIYMEYCNYGHRGAFELYYTHDFNPNNYNSSSIDMRKKDIQNGQLVTNRWGSPNWKLVTLEMLRASKINTPGLVATDMFEGAIDVPFPKEGGIYYIAVKASSQNGAAREGFYGPFLVDATAPTLPTITLVPNGWTSGDVRVTIGGSTALSGIQKYQYKIGQNGAWIDYDPNNPPTVTASGVTEVYAKAISNVGLESAEASATAKIDKAAPSTPTISLNPSGWSNVNVTITIAGSTAASGIQRYQYKIGDGAWIDYNPNSKPVVANEGNTIVYAKAISNVGLQSAEASATAQIDRTAPTGAISGNPVSWTNQDVILNFTASDVLSGMKEVIKPDGTVINGSTASQTISQNGTYTFIAVDHAGNRASISVDVKMIDKIAPTGIVTVPKQSIVKNGEEVISLTFTGSDVGSGVKRVGIVEGNTVIWKENASITTKDIQANGTYSFKVEDLAGNTATISEQVTAILRFSDIISNVEISNTNADPLKQKNPISFLKNGKPLIKVKFTVQEIGGFNTFSNPNGQVLSIGLGGANLPNLSLAKINEVKKDGKIIKSVQDSVSIITTTSNGVAKNTNEIQFGSSISKGTYEITVMLDINSNMTVGTVYPITLNRMQLNLNDGKIILDPTKTTNEIPWVNGSTKKQDIKQDINPKLF